MYTFMEYLPLLKHHVDGGWETENQSLMYWKTALFKMSLNLKTLLPTFTHKSSVKFRLLGIAFVIVQFHIKQKTISRINLFKS